MKQNVAQAKHWVIIPAAGIGARMQADRPKQYLHLSGKTVLEHTLDPFLNHQKFEAVYVGISPDDTFWAGLPCARASRIHAYKGGRERVDTVIAGLHSLQQHADDLDWVWVHDAARPCLEAADLTKLFDALQEEPADGVLLGAPIYDTVKRGNSAADITSTLDRSGLWRALTPQVFRFGQLKKALEKCLVGQVNVTDESSAIEYIGGKPRLLEAVGPNIKITRPGDLDTAMTQLSANNILMPRIGNGFDVHAFEPGDHVVLGGVTIPFEKGLKAHSDGDVVLHALMDGLLGALALGDIGQHFPDTDARWKGADSRALLRAVLDKVEAKGYRIGNVDLTVIAEQPKLARFIPAMQQVIAEDLRLQTDQVSLKATTSEKLGFTGRGEGIASQAAVMLFPKGGG